MRCSNDDIVRAVRHELVVRLKNSRCGLMRNDAGSRWERHVLLIVVERIPTLNICRTAHHPVDFRREQLFVERVRGEAREAGGLSRIMERRAILIVPLVFEKEKELVRKMNQLEELEIPENFDFKKIHALGNEAREKLTKIKPRTLGQASRISGINPSDVQILMVYMGR